MKWLKPFTFTGRIGRVELWLTMIFMSVAQVASSAMPVTSKKIVFSTFGGAGKSYVTYATPAVPLSVESWAFLAASYLILIFGVWVIAAALVKRLHDLGRSGTWVAVVVGGLLASTAVDALFSRPGAPLSISDVVSTILLVPICLLGAFGLFEAMFIRGEEGGWR